MKQITIDLSRSDPAWQQLVHAVLDQLAAGQLEAGAKLPSVRGMAQSVRLNPNTVARAYRELEVLGAAEGRQGRGVFVTPGGPEVARRERGGALKDEIRAAIRRARDGGLDETRIRAVVDEALGAGSRSPSGEKEKA